MFRYRFLCERYARRRIFLPLSQRISYVCLLSKNMYLSFESFSANIAANGLACLFRIR